MREALFCNRETNHNKLSLPHICSHWLYGCRTLAFSFRNFFLAIFAALAFVLPLTAQAAAGDFLIDGTPNTDADTLPSVIAALDTSPHTLTLQTSLTVAAGMMISGKDITFDLNGHDLTFNDYLYLTNTRIDYTGAGNFGVVGITFNALSANGGYVRVTNVTINADGYAGVSASNGAEIVVESEVNATGGGNLWGVSAASASKVTVNGKVNITNNGTGIGYGVLASGANTVVAVNGDVTATNMALGTIYGVYGYTGSEITVTGKISATGNNAVYSVFAKDDTTVVTINGDVSITENIDPMGRPTNGIYAYTGSKITVTGSVSAINAGVAVRTYSNDSAMTTSVTVGGNIFLDNSASQDCGCGIGILSTGPSSVTTNGNINIIGEFSSGANAQNGAQITVLGSITTGDGGGAGTDGAGAVITVYGPVTVNFAGGYVSNQSGVDAWNGGTTVIKNNVTVTTADPYLTGAMAVNGSTVTIDGILTATPYINLNNDNSYTPADETIPTTKDGYKTYTDGDSTVWIKDATSPAEALAFVGASSRKVHGAAGAFDLPIDASGSLAPGGAITVEPRSGGANGAFDLVFQFDHAVEQASATITGASPAQSIEYAGNEVILHLTGVPDAARLGVALEANGSSSITVNVAVGFLCGDVNGNRYVQPGDVSEIRTRTGAVTTAANFIYDVDTSGYIQPGDVSIVRTLSGHSLP